MYYPYLRGKQFELLALRESAQLIANAGFVPIIEPVKESFRGLQRALTSLSEAGARAVVIINPGCGDLVGQVDEIENFLLLNSSEFVGVEAGILISKDSDLNFLRSFLERGLPIPYTLIHSRIAAASSVLALIGDRPPARNVFISERSTMLYQTQFKDVGDRVLVKDGFEQKRNADYAGIDPFSDLHITYNTALSMDGFGDFLTIGDQYSNGGGPAYAVAIHLTFIDNDSDCMMFVAHFVSDTNDTPAKPANKFSEALDKLVEYLNSDQNKIPETSAVRELKRLSLQGHFPGLGYIKKLSIKHHFEVVADFMER